MTDSRLDPILGALAHPRRIAVMRCLTSEYLPIPVPSFATYLALSLFADAEADDFEEFRSEVHDSLYHVHLPILAEAGIVDYDPDLADGVIDEGPEFETAVALLEASE
ncbi:hypothetical protein M0R89_16610 [Halorussus limi]|uniref:DUF7344 domain-containing protein n=1 Tax=Halorussus limi TaxID=2938695 RepID=A0A8U0HTC8_9EURY|nr:hypothetical protein [Halorussus limi]UPV74148.1 hypothetical protein M0R89_16610 [Halorussus limi]